MTNINKPTDSDPYFYLAPSASSVPTTTAYNDQNPRKKRTKLIKVEPSLGPSTSTKPSASKPKYYSKKPDPSAPKITRPCSECGKKFWSWKALFGHMRCHPERQWRGINPPPNHRKSISLPPVVVEQRSTDVSSLNAIMSAEDHEVAESLLLLATSSSDVCDGVVGRGGGGGGGSFDIEGDQEDETSCRFECTSCKKVFGSHQALGGHRASHKNVKGCFAISSGGNCEQEELVEHNSSSNVLGGYHKCSICMKVFTSGQALGGHKRCHWEKFGEEASSSPSILNGAEGSSGLTLDLNLPAPIKDHESSSPFSSNLTLDLRLGL